jgi:SEC-C motif-containing protein
MRDEPKLSRNDPCPCGTGKNIKKCHGVSEGNEAAGVTANKPKVPKSNRGFATANFEADSE